MALSKLQFRPGINRESTNYSNEGGWYDVDKVRFRFGYPEKIGGWVRAHSMSFIGTCRALLPWVSLSHTPYLGIGTHRKYYIATGSLSSDITPIRRTGAAGTVTFAAFSTTLSSGVSATDTSLPIVAATTNMPAQGYVKVDSEIIFYAGLGTNLLTNCTRGVNNTTAATHAGAAAVNFSSLKVSDTGHGARVGDFVTFSGAATLGGQATAARLNQEYEIQALAGTNAYIINLRDVATVASITVNGELNPTLVFATSADTGSGGASAYGAYQISVGYDVTTGGTGWGTGPWGRSTWGSSWTAAQARLWSHDTYGEDLIMCVRDGGIYYWDTSVGIGTRAVALNSLPGANKVPTIAKQIMLSDRDRHIIAFGCDGEFTPGVQDPLLIRFSETESRVDWSAQPGNTAGDLRIGTGTEIVCAVETKQETLVFTDVSLHSMQFIGPPYTFGINMISAATSIMAPNAAVSTDDAVFWMGSRQFFAYAGTVQTLPCTVLNYVFDDFNFAERNKVFAANNKSFSEVWWFYPSAGSKEVDRYVVYNYQQGIWYYGNMSRTAWTDRGVREFPLAAAPDHYLYDHESGFDDGSVTPAAPIAAYIESAFGGVAYYSQRVVADGPSEASEGGNDFVFISRIIPDITFLNSTASSPSVSLVISASNFPGGPPTQADRNNISRIMSFAVEQFTNQIYTRVRGRAFAFRLESDGLGVTWRLGVPRVQTRSDGRR